MRTRRLERSAECREQEESVTTFANLRPRSYCDVAVFVYPRELFVERPKHQLTIASGCETWPCFRFSYRSADPYEGYLREHSCVGSTNNFSEPLSSPSEIFPFGTLTESVFRAAADSGIGTSRSEVRLNPAISNGIGDENRFRHGLNAPLN